MRGGKSMQKSYIIPGEFKRARIPGQIPSPNTLARMAGLDKKPPAFDTAMLTRQSDPMLSSDSIVKGLGFNATLEGDWRTFLRGVFNSSTNEIVLRDAVMKKALDEGHHPVVRRVILERSLNHWKEVRKSMVQVLTPDQILEKAEARGGKYYKRVPSKNGKRHRYFYTPDDYDKRDDAHVSGEDASKAYLNNKVCKCVMGAGKKGCKTDAFEPLVKKYGSKSVAQSLKDSVNGGKLEYKKGRFNCFFI